MRDASTSHGTIVIGSIFDAAASDVYAAFSDARELQRLGAAGSGPAVVVDEVDFRLGGRCVYRFGNRRRPRFRGLMSYIDIVPGHRIIATEAIFEREMALSVSISTLELRTLGAGTELKLTVQTAALDGADRIEGAGPGSEILFANLVPYLDEIERLRLAY